MIRKLTDAISASISGERLYSTVYDVAQFHRIQASTGYRAAAHYCCEKLNNMGIAAEILSYPANADAEYLGSRGFQEWDCKSARCDLVTPVSMTLADFSGDAISIIQRSSPCDFHKTPLEIVHMDRGSDAENYKDLDLTGKLLFIRSDFAPFMSWAPQKGALGFISDFVAEAPTRSRADLYDVKKYTSFWYKGDKDEHKLFGFVLSPRMGDKLAKICSDLSKEGKYPTVTCHVESALYDGALEVVSALLPGKSDREIVITAHLCHPRASANDNASGVAAAIEALGVLKCGIENGTLAPLHHSIRVLLVPEFAGTFAYYHSADAAKALAGINLDMVGGRQNGGYGPLTITQTPLSTPSFACDLSTLILDQLRRDVPSHGGMQVPMFNSTVTNFVGGSDHMILSDPLLDIPAPMLGQYPDLNYHTSGDTIAIIDPEILKKSCSIAAVYAYGLAMLQPEALPEIFGATAVNFVARLNAVLDHATAGTLVGTVAEHFSHITDFYVKGCQKIFDFLPGCPLVAPQVNRLQQLSDALLAGYAQLGTPQSSWQYADCVPQRAFVGLIDRIEGNAKTPEQKQALADFNKAHPDVLHENLLFNFNFYMDGKRTLSEAARLAVLDSNTDDKVLLHDYFMLLQVLNLVK